MALFEVDCSILFASLVNPQPFLEDLQELNNSTENAIPNVYKTIFFILQKILLIKNVEIY